MRRLSEHVAATLPLLAVLFLPIAFGAARLYPWMGPELAAGDELIAHKARLLNPGFFFVRSVVYLVVWCRLGWWYRKRSLDQDASGDPRITRRLQIFSAPAMVAFAVTLNFASFDWVMSLDAHWYSTIFGVYVFAGSTVAILSVLSLLAIFTGSGPLAGVVNREHLHDLGKLLFGFIVFWAYIGFSQYMLIWYGNLPEETIWFAHRMEHGWEWVTVDAGARPLRPALPLPALPGRQAPPPDPRGGGGLDAGAPRRGRVLADDPGGPRRSGRQLGLVRHRELARGGRDRLRRLRLGGAPPPTGTGGRPPLAGVLDV